MSNIRDFIGKQKEIRTVSELFYVCELGKYLYYYTGQALDISEVYFNEQLRNTQQWTYMKLALINGWIRSFHTMSIDLKGIDWPGMKQIANIFVWVTEPEKEPMQLSQISNHVITMKYNQTEDGYLELRPKRFSERIRSELVYLSFIAHMVIKNTLEKTHIKTLIKIESNSVDIGPYVMVYDLYESGLIKEWLEIKVNDGFAKDLKYRAWLNDGFEKGISLKQYSNQEKLAYMKKLDIAEKDVVFIYTRRNSKVENTIKSADLAIINEIKENEIKFTVIMNPRLRADIEQDYNKLNPTLKQMFSKKDLNNLNIIEKTFSMDDLGISQMVNKERYFIEPLGKTKDTVKTFMEKYLGNLINKDVEITQEEFIARLLRENNIDFNVQKYRDICINNGAVVEKNGRMDFRVIPQEIKDCCTTIRISEDGTVIYDNLANFRK